MERTLVAWNVPNMITIPLMAFLGFLVVGTVYQLFLRSKSSGGGTADNAGGY